MSRPAYPTGADLEQLVEGLKLFDEESLTDFFETTDLEIHASAAVTAWEAETGWRPFLADSVDVTRYFDPQGPNFRPQVVGGGYALDLGTGLISLTSINTGWTEDDAGQALTANTDYRLHPYNAAALSLPYTSIQFYVPQWGLRHSIRVIGKFGYSTTVPDDVWLAISHKGVMLALPEIATRVTGGMLEFSELGVTERYPAGFLMGKDSLGERWTTEWERTKSRYRRIAL